MKVYACVCVVYFEHSSSQNKICLKKAECDAVKCFISIEENNLLNCLLDVRV